MRNDIKILGGIGILTIIVVIVAAFTIGSTPVDSSQENDVLGESEVKFLVRKNSHKVGPKDPKVTLVEFADYQCPACGATHITLLKLKSEYKDRVEFVFRNFPLVNIHKNAYMAAMAAEAASAQGKYWEMHDMLFEYQDEWSEENDALKIFVKYAKEIGVADLKKFESDVKDNKYAEKIQADIDDGYKLGINSTPTFFINNEKLSGSRAYDDFKQKIDEALEASVDNK